MEESLILIDKYEKLLFEARYQTWIDHNLFSVRWWILFGMVTIPWFIWYRLIDKKRLQEMFLYLFTTSFIAVLLDEIGSSLSLWSYPVHLLPFIPRLITANYSMVPIIFTLVYQYFPKWKSFIIANIVLTLVFSLILEPILVLIKLYTLNTWKHIYSIPLYFTASILLKWFSEKIKSVQQRYSNNKNP